MIDIIRPFLGTLLSVLMLASIFGIALGKIPPGIADVESQTIQAIQAKTIGIRHILFNDPLYLIWKLPLYLLEKINLTSVSWIRSIGASFAVVSSLSIYLILKRWHSTRVAFLTTVLFASSSWILHYSRLAIPETSLLLLPVLIFLGIKMIQENSSLIYTYVIIVFSSLMLYIPGLIWIIIPAAIWQRKLISKRLKELKKLNLTLLTLVTTVALLPLLIKLFYSPEFILQLSGFDKFSIGNFLRNISFAASNLFINNNLGPIYTVAKLPYFDVPTIALLALGLFAYSLPRKLDRKAAVIGGIFFSLILIGIFGPSYYPLLMIFLYILCAAGLTYLLQEWFSVFPKNPIARGIGIALVTLIVLSSTNYHLRRYFIVWPNSPEVKATFQNS